MLARNQVTYPSRSPAVNRSLAGSLQGGRGHPHARADGAESQPAQLGAQLVAVMAVVLGDGEHRKHPAVVRIGLPEPEDPPVAGRQIGVTGGGQEVPGRTVTAFGVEEPARLQSHQGLAHRRLRDPGDAEAVDQVRHGDPATYPAQVAAGEGDDHRARRARAIGR